MTRLPLRPERCARLSPRALGRRDFLAAALGSAFAGACMGRPEAGPLVPADLGRVSGHAGQVGPADGVARAGREIELWSWFDLPAADPRSRELSGIAWDEKAGVLWAVQDEIPNIVRIQPDRDLRSWAFGPSQSVMVDIRGPVDLEGLVVLPDGFIVCSEVGPRIVEVDRSGHVRTEIQLPARFREARTNKSLESLTMSPSGRYLFTTTEVALGRDGERATTTRGTRVRIVRMNRTGGGEYTQASEHVYETDPAPFDGGDWGVSDLCAISDDELLVLERGFAKGRGNTVRIYHATLDGRASCLGVDELSPSVPTLEKTLRLDLSKLGGAVGLPEPKQPQPSTLLDNYEGITIGPRLPDGRSSLIVASDDNQRADQVARILVLAL
jgi:hypothetical protein